MLKALHLNPLLPEHPDRAPLSGGRTARAQPVHDALLAQDRVLAHGARVVAHVGLAGGAGFQADADLVPEDNIQTHPSTDLRVVARSKVRLTPGYSLAVRAACTRSGTQQQLDGADWTYVGAGGSIQVSVAYSNGIDALAVKSVLTPKASLETDGMEGTGAGAAWEELHEVSGTLYPQDLLKDASVQQKWSENVDASITVYYRGGVRVVDLCVYEVPLRYARDTEDDDLRRYATHLHTSGASQPLPVYPSPWPMTRRSDATGGDETGGPLAALAVAATQAGVLGPALLSWTAWRETADVDLTEAPAIAITSSSWVQLLATGLTSWSSARAGWGAGAAGLARQADLAGPLELRGVAAVVPVRLRAWARVTDDTNPGTLRLQSSTHVLVELPITSEDWAWREVIAWLECGLNGDDPQTWQMLAKLDGLGGALEVRYIAVDYASGLT